MEDSSDWLSFWDLANPEEGALAVEQLYGAAAATAAARCAAAARADDRDDDYRFWIAVLARLRAADRRLTEVANQLQEAHNPEPGGML